jgi:hypothetical protein
MTVMGIPDHSTQSSNALGNPSNPALFFNSHGIFLELFIFLRSWDAHESININVLKCS